MAQEVPPYQRLSPDSQPWGRWVTDKIQKNEVAQDSALTNLQAQNKSLAAQLNRLQLQIADLNERRSYTASALPSLLTTTPSTYRNYSGSTALPFTLKNQSIVRISGSATLSASVIGNSSSVGAEGSFGLYVDTPPAIYPSPDTSAMSAYSSVYYDAGTSLQTIQISQSMAFGTTITLDAGDHLVAPLPIGTYVIYGGSSGSVQLENMFFSVDVLGLA